MREPIDYDYSKLNGRIKEKCKTQGRFAMLIGRSSVYVSNVLNGKAFFEQRDIDIGAKVLSIPDDKIGAFFFTKKVHNNGTMS